MSLYICVCVSLDMWGMDKSLEKSSDMFSNYFIHAEAAAEASHPFTATTDFEENMLKLDAGEVPKAKPTALKPKAKGKAKAKAKAKGSQHSKVFKSF